MVCPDSRGGRPVPAPAGHSPRVSEFIEFPGLAFGESGPTRPSLEFVPEVVLQAVQTSMNHRIVPPHSRITDIEALTDHIHSLVRKQRRLGDPRAAQLRAFNGAFMVSCLPALPGALACPKEHKTQFSNVLVQRWQFL